MRQEILRALATESEKEVAGHILDLIEKTLERQSVEVSWFLTLSEQDLVAQIMRRFPQVNYIFTGGFPRAERKQMVVGPAQVALDDKADLVALEIQVRTGPQVEELSQRDLQGAVLGLGLNRRYVGDIVRTDNGGEVVVVTALAPVIVQNLISVSRYPAQAVIIALQDLSVGVERKKLVKATVAALRLDAVAAAGFGKSRSWMAREIKSLRVRVNGSPAKSSAQLVKEGDIISLGGKGRVVLVTVGGRTKKDRIFIEMERYY